MRQKVAIYFLGIWIFVLGTQIYDYAVNNQPMRFDRLWIALPLSLIVAFGVWVRRDWTREKWRERRKEEARRNAHIERDEP